jgi:NAD(P) transhydrogenase subunit beta
MTPTTILLIKGLAYLFGSITFIVGLKMMGNAKSASQGNKLAAIGMVAAILATIFLHTDASGQLASVPAIIYLIIFGAIGLGTVVGWMTAMRVQMTKMPELVSMFNGMGGACAALIGLMEFAHNTGEGKTGTLIAILLGMVIGSISFSGSVIAFLKLNGTMGKPIRLPFYNILNTVLLIGLSIFTAYMVHVSSQPGIDHFSAPMGLLYGLFAVAIILWIHKAFD